MLKFFKKLKWLLAHQEDLQRIVESRKPEQEYSLAGVPEYQIPYIQKQLGKDK